MVKIKQKLKEIVHVTNLSHLFIFSIKLSCRPLSFSTSLSTEGDEGFPWRTRFLVVKEIKENCK